MSFPSYGIVGMRMRSGPRAKSVHLRGGWPSCARTCQLMTFLIVMNMYVCTYVHTYVRMIPHSEPRANVLGNNVLVVLTLLLTSNPNFS